MKKLIFLLLLLFNLAACESVPFRLDAIYGEIEAATIEVGVTDGKTENQIAYDKKRLEKATARFDHYEKKVELANTYYETRAACRATMGYVWLCKGREAYSDTNPPEHSDALVRAYRRDHGTCGCITKDRLRDIFQQSY